MKESEKEHIRRQLTEALELLRRAGKLLEEAEKRHCAAMRELNEA